MQGTRDRARHSIQICRTEGRAQGLWEARSRLSVGFRPLPQTTPGGMKDKAIQEALVIVQDHAEMLAEAWEKIHGE
ncbi:hypothetical protein WG31_14785 (plasmid) [Acetobacter oryzifermentans]|uniref:Uncharacterized protein n=1 Tax=Acetobacter oryzifermentans TaxID=1633874 RepID=A0ABN4NY30_9PROT|nr:hypothetical protein WG31_14785 [Acetobacter oryzifermentans]